MDKDIERILKFLKDTRNLDFSGSRESMVVRRVRHRFPSTKCATFDDYFQYLQNNPDELDRLIDSLTINVSSFFRDSLTFEYIADRILPDIVHQKKEAPQTLRVWSAGCAMGEEPYSIAILINEFCKKEAVKVDINIFATDIDGKILKKSQTAAYPFESIRNVKYRLLQKYFNSSGNEFRLIPEIKSMVSFSVYDILDQESYAPPESIFGNFDLVFCRNVLIYFNKEYQDLIFHKLYRALTKDGFLVLGESEIPLVKYQMHFKKVNDCCHIYQKR